MQKFKINKKEFAPGENAEINLFEYRLPTRTMIEIPVHVFRSKHPGPTALLSAGMHGDEINGIETLRNLMRMDEIRNPVSGSIVVIPIVNIVSFINISRELPDGKDLNRSFPGTSAGSLGSRIAHAIMKEIIPVIDFGVDFHTGGAKINNYPQIRCSFEDSASIDLAHKFKAPFILNSPYRDKSFRKEAAKKKKPILVFEAGESMRMSKLAVDVGIQGCLHLLNEMGIIEYDVEPRKSYLLENTKWIRSKASGLFVSYKKYGSAVKIGEVLGIIADPYGDMEVELKAPEDGFIIGLNNQPVVNEGDALIHVGY